MKESKLRSILDEFYSSLRPAAPRLYNLAGSAAALLLALREEPFLMVEHTEEVSRVLGEDVLFFRKLLGRTSVPLRRLPEPDGPELAGRRAEALYGLPEGGTASPMLITSEGALEAPQWEPRVLAERVLALGAGDEIAREEAARRLHGLGYRRAPLVTEPGQYSLRGWILDIYPSTDARAMRVEFFGEEIENIRAFDVDTQRSVAEVEGVLVMPAVEPGEGPGILDLLTGVPVLWSGDNHAEPPAGAVVLSRYGFAGEGIEAPALSIAGLGILPGERKDVYSLPAVLQEVGKEHRVIVVSSSEGQAERLRQVFLDGGLIVPRVPLEEVASYAGRYAITVGGLSEGLFLRGLLVLTEKEIFGGRPAYRPLRKSRVSGLLRNVDDLLVGDHVVHSDRGIGRFEGLVRQSVEDVEYDMLVLRYAEGDRLYVPLDAIDRVRKYHAEEGVVPELDSLRSRRWQRTKQRVRKKVQELASRLLKVYAEREVAEGFRFSPDTEMHREFDSFFPYEETPDQLRAVREIKEDMESARPMDRLLCGDVGYGKTEVAMRAAFKAVYDGKQVAVLVPTTLLCEQHHRIFTKRFAAFPVTIDSLSRFKTPGERRQTLRKVKRGEVDIVIATHALLRRDMEFRDLGLLVIDEEHRFGVRQKERIKELKRGVDVLSLSATPIPRTLQMSLSGIRGMSLIETPPEERLAVQSAVSAFDRDLIRSAVQREVDRRGQVFYVHNRIQDIDGVAARLRDIVPLARIAVAHGRMPEGKLEEIMLRFLNREVDVLLSTAIVGAGLDIPTANTIIVDMAHRMGLADLYQLRGRVGRSNLRAYAFFIIPGERVLTDEARKRLQAIQDLSYMGAGFRLAMRDLEIRGAGNLLGPEQSGNIHAVGFDLYVEMLEEAVAGLRGLEVKEAVRTEISLRVDAYVPDDYIEDMALRLSVYRRISGARSPEDLEDIEAEMADRFGPPPPPFGNLLRVRSLGIAAERLHMTEITARDAAVRFTLSPETELSPEDILSALNGRVRFLPNGFELSAKGDLFEETGAALEALSRAAGGPPGG
jgi:transcription-repair coupling factor (superfamily II helicase)